MSKLYTYPSEHIAQWLDDNNVRPKRLVKDHVSIKDSYIRLMGIDKDQFVHFGMVIIINSELYWGNYRIVFEVVAHEDGSVFFQVEEGKEFIDSTAVGTFEVWLKQHCHELFK